MKNIDVMRCCLVREKTLPYKTETVRDLEEAAGLFREAGLADSAEEIFAIACLDAKCRLSGYHEVSHGCLDSTIVHPREVYKRALLNNAAAIIMCHNHPSGSADPSREDITTTKRILGAGEVLGIELIDHIIIAGDEVFSFRREGLM